MIQDLEVTDLYEIPQFGSIKWHSRVLEFTWVRIILHLISSAQTYLNYSRTRFVDPNYMSFAYNHLAVSFDRNLKVRV